MRIRVLKLESWMHLIDIPEHNRLLPVLQDYKPPYGFPIERDGYYCVTFNRWHTDCWIQVRGKAYRYNATYFMYSLHLLNASEMNHRRLSFLSNAAECGRASYYDKEMLRYAEEYQYLRKARRGILRLFARRRGR